MQVKQLMCVRVYMCVDMIVETSSIVNKFISVPRDMQEFFTSSAFVAGIVAGMLDSSGFVCCFISLSPLVFFCFVFQMFFI